MQPWGSSLRKVPDQEIADILGRVFAELELTECIDRYPNQLSGGQKAASGPGPGVVSPTKNSSYG